MRKIILIFLMTIILPVCARSADSKIYETKADETFMTALSAISKLNFDIIEMQANSGYILFQTKSGDAYLIMISEENENNSSVKISKLKNSSPLSEIQSLVFSKMDEETKNIPTRIDK